MRHIAPTSGLTPIGISCVHTNFTVSPSFKIKKMISTLGSNIFFTVWPWTHHDWTSSRMFNSPQKTPIVRARFAPQPKWFRQWPNESKTMNLLESGPVTERSLSKDVDHNRLVNIRMNKTNSLKKKSAPRSSTRKVCSYIFLSDLYKYSNSWLHNDFSFGFTHTPLL